MGNGKTNNQLREANSNVLLPLILGTPVGEITGVNQHVAFWDFELVDVVPTRMRVRNANDSHDFFDFGFLGGVLAAIDDNDGGLCDVFAGNIVRNRRLRLRLRFAGSARRRHRRESTAKNVSHMIADQTDRGICQRADKEKKKRKKNRKKKKRFKNTCRAAGGEGARGDELFLRDLLLQAL